jgi:hypothetical protein
LERIYIKILSVEEVHRRRRKTRECAVEAHSGGQCTERGIKKEEIMKKESRKKEG